MRRHNTQNSFPYNEEYSSGLPGLLSGLVRRLPSLLEVVPRGGDVETSDSDPTTTATKEHTLFSIAYSSLDAGQRTEFTWFHHDLYLTLPPSTTAIIDNITSSAISKGKRSEIDISSPQLSSGASPPESSESQQEGRSWQSWCGPAGLRVIVVPVFSTVRANESCENDAELDPPSSTLYESEDINSDTRQAGDLEESGFGSEEKVYLVGCIRAVVDLESFELAQTSLPNNREEASTQKEPFNHDLAVQTIDGSLQAH